MSRALTIYLVNLGQARGAVASGDEKLRRMLSGRFKDDMARDDDYFASAIGRGAPTRREALRAVIHGGPFDRQYGWQYGYAYEMICRHFGRYLNNNHFSPFRGSWLETVDEGLDTLGMTAVRVTSFMYGALPEPLPRPDEVPGYGEWTAAQCREGLAQWSAAMQAGRHGEVDAQVLDAIRSCVAWMQEALRKPGSGIAGFGS